MAKKHGIERITLETSSLWADLRSIADTVYTSGKSLSGLGSLVTETIFELHAHASVELLEYRATWLRSAAQQALTVALQIGAQAGRLEQIADVKKAIDPDLSTPEN